MVTTTNEMELIWLALRELQSELPMELNEFIERFKRMTGGCWFTLALRPATKSVGVASLLIERIEEEKGYALCIDHTYKITFKIWIHAIEDYINKFYIVYYEPFEVAVD